MNPLIGFGLSTIALLIALVWFWPLAIPAILLMFGFGWLVVNE